VLLTAIGASALAAAGLTLLDLGWPALVLGLLLIFLSFPAGLGHLRRLVLTGLVYVGFGLTLGTVFSILGRPLPPALLAALFVLSAGVLAILRARRHPWRLTARSGDVVIAVTGLALSAVFLHWGIGEDAAGLVSQLSIGGDNANHLNLVRAIQLGQGYQYSGSTSVPGLLGGMEAYPQGFAYLVGYTGWLFDGLGSAPTVAQTVWSSWGMLALQPVLAVVLVLLIVRALLLGSSRTDGERASGDERSTDSSEADSALRLGPPMAAAAVAVSVVLLLTLYVHLWSFGFQTQMFAMNAVLVAVWLAMDPALRGGGFRGRSLVLLGISVTVVAIASSWYLLAPPAVAVALLVAWPMTRRLREVPPWLWPGVAVAVVAACYPVLRGPSDCTGQLVMPGGVHLFSPLTGTALLVIGAVVAYARRGPRWWIEPLPVALATALALALGVGLFQLFQAGAFSYYFFKTLYLPATLLVVPLGYGAATLVGRRFGLRDRRLVTGFVSVAALALAVVAASEARVLFSEPRGQVDEAVVREVFAEYPEGMTRGRDVVAAAYCDWRVSGQTTSWIGGLFTSWNAPRQQFYLAVDRGVERPADLFAYGLASPERQIVVHTKDNCSLHTDFISGIPGNMKLVSGG